MINKDFCPVYMQHIDSLAHTALNDSTYHTPLWLHASMMDSFDQHYIEGLRSRVGQPKNEVLEIA